MINTAIAIMLVAILSILVTQPLGREEISGGLFLFGMFYLWIASFARLVRNVWSYMNKRRSR